MDVETEARLSPLRGRLLWTYRAVWCALALCALAFLTLSVSQPVVHPVIVALRLVKGAVLITVTAILLRRRAHDPVAALLSLALLTWTITSSFDFSSAAAAPLLLDRIRFLLFALALLFFPDGSWRPGWTRRVALASGTVFVIGVAETSGLLPTKLFLPLAILCILAAVASLVSRYRSAATEALRQQLKWVALGLVTGVGLILCARGGAALSASSPQLAPMATVWEAMFQLGVVAIAVGFLVSLLRYRLFDAEAAISRSAAYAALTIAVVATFGGTEALIENLGQAYLGMWIGSVSGAMAAAIAALLFSPLQSRINDWAEHYFQPELALLKHQMPKLLERLSASSSTRQICTAVLPHFNAAIHASRSAFLLQRRIVATSGMTMQTAQRWARDCIDHDLRALERAHDDPIFPLRLALGGTSLGATIWLLLGPRPDGTLYGREDLDAVRSTFPTLQRALTSSIAREALGSQISHRENLLRAEVNSLRERVRMIEISTLHSPTCCTLD
jgi:hypothetical protein